MSITMFMYNVFGYLVLSSKLQNSKMFSRWLHRKEKKRQIPPHQLESEVSVIQLVTQLTSKWTAMVKRFTAIM